MQLNLLVLREILSFLDRIDLYQLQLISWKFFNFIANNFNDFPCDYLDSITWEPEHNAWAIYTTQKGLFDNPKRRLTCEELISSRIAAEKFHRCYEVTIKVSSVSVYNSRGDCSQLFLDTMRSVAHLWTYNTLEISWSDSYDVHFSESFATQMFPMLCNCYTLELRNPPLAILDLDTLYCASNITHLRIYNTREKLENASFVIKLAESVNTRPSFIPVTVPKPVPARTISPVPNWLPDIFMPPQFFRDSNKGLVDRSVHITTAISDDKLLDLLVEHLTKVCYLTMFKGEMSKSVGL
ncbi:hypothetical protein Ddc_18621 [Ditylenchus destructor]|nr:hypothetical protein Ddc_18621 [Ditylenchus destructor]